MDTRAASGSLGGDYDLSNPVNSFLEVTRRVAV